MSDWPCGRGCYQSSEGSITIWFGDTDHLMARVKAKGFVLNEVVSRLRTVLDVVEGFDGVGFMSSTRYGYVTSSPSHLGTGFGLVVSLPKLVTTSMDRGVDKVTATCNRCGSWCWCWGVGVDVVL